MTLLVVHLLPLPVPPAVTLIDLMASLTSLVPSLLLFGMLLFSLPALTPVFPSESNSLSEKLR